MSGINFAAKFPCTSWSQGGLCNFCCREKTAVVTTIHVPGNGVGSRTSATSHWFGAKTPLICWWDWWRFMDFLRRVFEDISGALPGESCGLGSCLQTIRVSARFDNAGVSLLCFHQKSNWIELTWGGYFDKRNKGNQIYLAGRRCGQRTVCVCVCKCVCVCLCVWRWGCVWVYLFAWCRNVRLFRTWDIKRCLEWGGFEASGNPESWQPQVLEENRCCMVLLCVARFSQQRCTM